MPYTPDPTNVAQPLGNVDASTAAPEFRALKAYIATLAGLGGGMNLFRKNAIIGGDFSTNPWQRGTSFAAIANGDKSADRWEYVKNGTMVHTVAKTADAPTAAQAGMLSSHCLLADCTTADAAIAAGDYCYIKQLIEGYNFASMLAQRIITISFWHKHTKTGIYCVALRNSGSDRSYVAEYTQDVTDTWEYATVTFTASPSAGTWDYTTGVGLSVIFCLAAGTTFHTTAGAWNIGDFFATANQVNACDSTANNFKIELVQVESGSAATPFENLLASSVLEASQRYYEKSYPLAIAVPTTATIGYEVITSPNNVVFPTGSRFGFIPYKVIKRLAPTVVIYPYTTVSNTGRVSNGSGTDLAANSGDVGADSSARGFYLQNGSGADLTPTVGSLIFHWSASAEL